VRSSVLLTVDSIRKVATGGKTRPLLWHLDDLQSEIVEALERGGAGDGKLIDGRALAVKASPARADSTHLIVGTAALPPNFHTLPHSHEADEVAVFLSGRGSVEIEGERFPVGPGTVLLTPSGAEHVTYSDDPDERLVALWFYAPPGSELRWIEPTEHETSGHAG
jgi:mannose-6-phosphate isomerase-like protein (cupin superfamily)